MNDKDFSKSFWLNKFSYSKYHYNDNRHGAKVNYIGYMIDGYAILKSTDLTVKVQKGDFLYIPKGCCYESFWYGEPTVSFYSFGFMHSPITETSMSIQTIEASEEAIELCKKIKTGITADSMSIGYVYQLLGVLAPKLSQAEPSSKERLVKKAIDYMRTNPAFTVSDVAKYCMVSESGLYSAFRKVIGKTPIDTKNEILAQKVMALLTTTNMTLDEICEALHFSSVSYMRRIFRGRYNMTPKEARKEISIRHI